MIVVNIIVWPFYCRFIDDPQAKSKFLRKHLESESEIRSMLKIPEPKTAAELVSKN